MAARELLLALFERMAQLDISTIEKLVELAERAQWPAGIFFREGLKHKARTAFSGSDIPTPWAGEGDPRLGQRADEPGLTPAAERSTLDIDELTEVLGPDGALARSLPEYEYRLGQIEMMQGVARSLNEDGHLIVEAGTGIGKSLAYLLPSVLFARANGVPVLVSTNTINLQEQLIGKDIPDLVGALSNSGRDGLDELRVAQLKGRGNYLCVKKYETMMSSGRLSPEQARLLARVTVWLLSTTTGDRGELNIGGTDLSVWSKICAEADERLEGRCPHRQRDSCFLYRARAAAERAHLVVVNHALLLSDMVAETKILPPYGHLVVDEAHHLEDEATEQLGSTVRQWDLLNYLSRFRQDTGGQRPAGILSWLSETFRSGRLGAARRSHLTALGEVLAAAVERSELRMGQFLDRVRSYVDSRVSGQGSYDRYLLLTLDMRLEAAWSIVETAWEDLELVLRDIADGLDKLYVALEGLDEREVHDRDYLMLELTWLHDWTGDLLTQLGAFVTHPESANVYWLVVAGRTDGVEFHAAPLSVADALERALFLCKESVVLTSATLSTGGDFEYIRGRLGMNEGSELILPAPFDYKASTLVYLPHDIPAPTHPEYQKAFEEALTALCLGSRGRALVLFTSHSALRATLEAIRAPLEEQGILVLGHGVDGTPKQLKAALRENAQTVLLGTASFWEGIDVPGEALSVLAIARLPFNVPTDPVFSARSALFDDPFNQYAIPQAAIRFKQGFGRLIRSRGDRGVVVVFDKRVQTKRYGSTFLNSVPECTVVRGLSRDLPAAVARWLNQRSE
jgi:DNA polymerase-3 subunit epsilon/ATP-dependent DNA helicase DinG